MPDVLAAIGDAKRILVEARLRPVQGARFQPTGFPSLGAASFRGPSDTEMLLVESAQSMANRLEATIWDAAADDLLPAFAGLPYVATSVNGRTTDSIREAHRLNSPYLVRGIEDEIKRRAEISGKKNKGKVTVEGGENDESSGVDIRKLANAIFYLDPNSVLHGVFLEKIAGLARLTRVLSAFIEADNVRPVESGGVKNDRIDPNGRAKGGAKEGFGNVPYSRTEYTAEKITAYFSVDLALLRSYGLGKTAEDLLIAMALWKIVQFLENGGRLRTACDFEADGEPRVTRPVGFAFPSSADLEALVRTSIATLQAEGRFASPSRTEVPFETAAK